MREIGDLLVDFLLASVLGGEALRSHPAEIVHLVERLHRNAFDKLNYN